MMERGLKIKPDVSIVIPAFNEAKHLPLFLECVITYCKNSKMAFEIIVVDDGSFDNTCEIAASYKNNFSNLDVIRTRKNRGKGYAVRRGLFKARGDICVFMDADGSVQPMEIGRNLRYLQTEGYDIFVGSRALKHKNGILRARWHRKFIGKIFAFFVRIFLLKDIKDTQCGFKMFKMEVIYPLFSKCRLRGFGFDMEILYLARKMGYRIVEGPVSWHHVKGSKVNLLRDSFKMFINIFQIKIWHSVNGPDTR